MNDIAPGIEIDRLHNQPPLDEVITEETAAFRTKRDALLQSLRDSKIRSDEDAANVTTLGVMLKTLRDAVEKARKERAEPVDQQKATIQRLFKSEIIDPLDGAMANARGMLGQWRTQQEAARDAERRKRDEEAAAARAAAEKLAQEKRDAEAKGDPQAALKAELAEIQARDNAAALESDQGAIRPDAVVHVQVGSAITTTHVTGKIDNIGAFLAWLIRNDAKWLSEAIQPRADRLMRTGMSPDGVSRVETKGTSFRR